jgi:N-methylhydantoinase B
MGGRRANRPLGSAVDAVALEVFNHRLGAIAEEMGVCLCRSAYSPNIKERRDYSCAVFDAAGELVAQAAHIPVHLGSTPLSVRAALARHSLAEGDVAMLNDPFAGGTHLPDVTVVAPVYDGRHLIGYVANRAHHADIGGMSPGSMPLAREIYQEGLRIPPVKIVRRGAIDEDVLAIFLANARMPSDRRGDLLAQFAALRAGGERLRESVRRDGRRRVAAAMAAIQAYAERSMREALRLLPRGIYRAEDWLDDDGLGHESIRIAAAVEIGDGWARVDFAGTDGQVEGGVNANYAVTLAAVYYAFRCVAGAEVPANAGMMRPIEVDAPVGSVVNASFPAAVAGGNVETSQRIVDVMFRALADAVPDRIPAASCGSMNNLAFGGYDPVRARHFSYYETIAGGAGASASGAGASAVQTHMTNTMNTPIEALEAEMPVRVVRYAIRRGSGGRGQHRGGDGIDREIEFLSAVELTILSERRSTRPFGIAGGSAGRSGDNRLQQPDGRTKQLPAKTSVRVPAGGRVRIRTPGGGAWGTKPRPGTRP